jgi:hypothetical protein
MKYTAIITLKDIIGQFRNVITLTNNFLILPNWNKIFTKLFLSAHYKIDKFEILNSLSG